MSSSHGYAAPSGDLQHAEGRPALALQRSRYRAHSAACAAAGWAFPSEPAERARTAVGQRSRRTGSLPPTAPHRGRRHGLRQCRYDLGSSADLERHPHVARRRDRVLAPQFSGISGGSDDGRFPRREAVGTRAGISALAGRARGLSAAGRLHGGTSEGAPGCADGEAHQLCGPDSVSARLAPTHTRGPAPKGR